MDVTSPSQGPLDKDSFPEFDELFVDNIMPIVPSHYRTYNSSTASGSKNNILLDVPHHVIRARMVRHNELRSNRKVAKFVLAKVFMTIASVYSRDVHAQSQLYDQRYQDTALQKAMKLDTPLHILHNIFNRKKVMAAHTRPPDPG